MKFGQHLAQNQFPPWQNEYIQYNELKYFLKQRQLSPTGWTREDELYFSENLIVTELNKVNVFIHLKIKQVGFDARKIQDLINYINLNDIGFYKMLKKHDKWTGLSLLTSIRFSSIHHQFQSFVTHLSQINTPSTSSNKIEAEEEEQIKKTTTTTTKYWIHLDNLTEVKAILLFHLPATSSNIIDTIYFDNPSYFTLYSQLIERNEKAEVIRARW
jgi:SPX domain protein involved in polyphosphate accumulation